MDERMLLGIFLMVTGVVWLFGASRRAGALERRLRTLAMRQRHLEDELAGYVGGQLVESGTVRTRRLELVDDEGTPMARLSFSVDGPALDLLDRCHRVRASLWVEERGPAFILYDDEGNVVHSAP